MDERSRGRIKKKKREINIYEKDINSKENMEKRMKERNTGR